MFQRYVSRKAIHCISFSQSGICICISFSQSDIRSGICISFLQSDMYNTCTSIAQHCIIYLLVWCFVALVPPDLGRAVLPDGLVTADEAVCSSSSSSRDRDSSSSSSRDRDSKVSDDTQLARNCGGMFLFTAVAARADRHTCSISRLNSKCLQ
jgi:hypothetical protein